LVVLFDLSHSSSSEMDVMEPMMPIPITWNDEILLVERLVLPSCSRHERYQAALHDLADRLHLETGDEYSKPMPGDFWVGCSPLVGWGGTDPGEVGWASFNEVPPAILRLLTAANWYEQRSGSRRSEPMLLG